VGNDSFGDDIILKPYPRYIYQAVSKGLKTAEKEAFLKTINRVSDHLYGLNQLRKRIIVFWSKNK
jgi:hypothetical protein